MKRPLVKRRVATLSLWGEAKKFMMLASVPLVVSVFSIAQQPSQIKLFKDVVNEITNRISVSSSHISVNINKLVIEDSAAGKLYKLPNAKVATVQPTSSIPLLKASYTKLKGVELKERRTEQFLDIMTERAYNAALKNGIPQAYMFAENITLTSRNIVLALAYKESGLGTNPASKGNALQTIETTRMEYFQNFGERFVQDVMPHAPEQAKAVQLILPYINTKYLSGNKVYLTDDALYEKEYGKLRIKSGYSKKPVKDYLVKITKDPLISAVFTMYHLKQQYNNRIVKPCKAANDKQTLQFFEELGDTKYRLIHFLGADGALGAVKNRHRTQKGTAYKVIRKASQRKILSISNTASGQEAFKAMIVDFQSVVERMTVLSAIYRVSPEGRNDIRRQIGLLPTKTL